MSNLPDLSLLVSKLSGLTLGRVAFHRFHVQLYFVGEYNAFLEINKAFEVADLDDRQVDLLVPGNDGAQIAAMRLVAMIDQTVEQVCRAPSRWEIRLSDGRIVIALDAEDFEPIVFSGSHHLSPSEIAWHRVVVADS